MSMRYTGKSWKRVKKASGETLLECIKQAKYNERRSRKKERPLNEQEWANLMEAQKPRKSTKALRDLMRLR